MKEDKAKKLLRDTISRSVNHILKYPYGFTYHWHYAGVKGVMTVVPGNKHKFYQVYLIYRDSGMPERTYGTVSVSKHVLKFLLINYFKKTTYFNTFMHRIEHGSIEVRQEVYQLIMKQFCNVHNVLYLQALSRFSIRSHPELEKPVKNLFKVNLTISDLEKVLNEMK